MEESNVRKTVSKYKVKHKTIPVAVRKRLAKIHVLTHSELKKLFAAITNLRDQALFLLAYRHGLRASEIVLLRTEDLDFEKPKINIRRIGRGPTGSHDLRPDEHVALQRYLESRKDSSAVLFVSSRGQPITRRGLDWLMKSYGAQARVPVVKRHFHALKHSIATHLLSAGANLHFVHEWLGHTMLQSTAIYLYLVKGRSGRQRFEAPPKPSG